VKLEYLFTDLGRTNNNNGFFFNNNNFRERNHIVRAGLNYKFDWFGAPAPVVARPGFCFHGLAGRKKRRDKAAND